MIKQSSNKEPVPGASGAASYKDSRFKTKWNRLKPESQARTNALAKITLPTVRINAREQRQSWKFGEELEDLQLW